MANKKTKKNDPVVHVSPENYDLISKIAKYRGETRKAVVSDILDRWLVLPKIMKEARKAKSKAR